MSLQLFNTYSRTSEPFQPIEEGKVSMYVCGMTVYDYCHIGHARSMLSFDVMQRWLKASGYEVTYVRNITDIDDKIIKRAVERGITMKALTDEMIAAMYEDADRLFIERPTHDPRATDYVPHMLDMVRTLQDKGLAYESASGDVHFAVRKFDNYGKLSGKSLDDLQAGERVSVADDKHDPLDFVLWKANKVEDPEEARWDASKWNMQSGRPGWHIECSAMSCALLGESFDIHGGGADLQFPHHENEIAQSECANDGKRMANYWVHNGFVNIDNEKMSKSLGNFFTIREVLEQFAPETLRFFIIRTHYRSPLNYSDAHLRDAHGALTRLYTALAEVPATGNGTTLDWNNDYAKRFKTAMDNDLATPEAIAVLFELATEVNKTKDSTLSQLLTQLGGVLGILQDDPQAFLQTGNADDLTAEAIEAQIAARAQAKADKNYAEADRIRDTLAEQGVILKDSPTGTTWQRG